MTFLSLFLSHGAPCGRRTQSERALHRPEPMSEPTVEEFPPERDGFAKCVYV